MTRLVALFEALTLLEAVLTGGHMVGSRLWFVYSISRNEKAAQHGETLRKIIQSMIAKRHANILLCRLQPVCCHQLSEVIGWATIW